MCLLWYCCGKRYGWIWVVLGIEAPLVLLGFSYFLRNFLRICYPILLPTPEPCWQVAGRMTRENRIKGLYQKRGWFYYQPPTPKDGDGKRPAGIALGTKDLVEAIQLLDERRADIDQWRAAKRHTMEEYLPGYFRSKATDSRQAVMQREMVVRSFCEVMGNPKMHSITQEMIEQWMAHVEKHGANPASGEKRTDKHGKLMKPKLVTPRSPATIRTYLVVLKAFFNWAVEEKILTESPMKRLKRQTTVAKTKVQEFLTEEERERVLAMEMPEHVRFILMFGFFAGLRDGEMLAMTRRWLWISPDGKRGTVTVQNQPFKRTDGSLGLWQPKVREMRTIPLHDRLLGFLNSYGLRDPWMLKPQREFWPNANLHSKRYDCHKTLNKMAKQAGVKKLNYHILRHSFATHLAMKGVSLADIAGLLGDTLAVTEDNYAGYCPGRANPLAVL